MGRPATRRELDGKEPRSPWPVRGQERRRWGATVATSQLDYQSGLECHRKARLTLAADGQAGLFKRAADGRAGANRATVARRNGSARSAPAWKLRGSIG